MRIAITGSTGLIGSRLSPRLTAAGHDVVAVVRSGSHGSADVVRWDPGAATIDFGALEGVDAVIHLAGEPIAAKRWTTEQKARIHDSRTQGTTLIANAITQLNRRPGVFLSASAIGYYGDTGDRPTDESGPAGDDFTARVCVDWEQPTAVAAEAGIRTVLMRSGVVLAAEGGALAKQLPFFKFCLGGRSGSGRQYLSWIAIDDEVAAIEWLLHAEVSGPVNLTAPNPVTNAEFARTLGKVLQRPTTIIPMIGPRVLYGRELADSLLLTSQRIVPNALEAGGFEFATGDLDSALRHILHGDTVRDSP